MHPSQLSPRVSKSLKKLGSDIDIARRKRRLTVTNLCQRAGISAPLYRRIVSGSPGTSIAAYAMIFFALGLGLPLEELIDASKDSTGLLLDQESLPKRIRQRTPGA